MGKKKRPESRIICYNINKDLAELIRLTISKKKVNDAFIYPELKQYAGTILNDYLRGLVQESIVHVARRKAP
jgi:hypothetical protein